MAEERWVPRCPSCHSGNVILGWRYGEPQAETAAKEYQVYCSHCGWIARLTEVLWVRL